MNKTVELITVIGQMCLGIGMVAEAWHRKWLYTHPPDTAHLVETDAEIISLFYKTEFLRPREKQRAEIYVRFLNEKGKKTNAKLSTVPIRHELEQFAPELQVGVKVRIRYDRKHPHIFYFAEPRYAAPEVSGQPYVKAGWLRLTLATILLALIIAANAVILWLTFHE